MSPSQWGPPTWVFIHTLAEKIKEDHFNAIGKPVIYNILQICNNLPCPECSDHAKQLICNYTIVVLTNSPFFVTEHLNFCLLGMEQTSALLEASFINK